MNTVSNTQSWKAALCIGVAVFVGAPGTALAADKPTEGTRTAAATFKVLNLNHTCFTVSDLDLMIRFFAEGLGMEVEMRRPVPGVIGRLMGVSNVEVEQAFLKGGGYRIELLSYKSPPDRKVISSSPVDTGSVHLGVYVDDAKAAVAKASAYGFALMGELVEIDTAGDSSPIKAMAWVRNTDGITVEFLEIQKR